MESHTNDKHTGNGVNGDTNQQGQVMPIAVIGMSCRLSGDVSSLDNFWEMMTRARCGWSEIPEDRFSKDAYYHPNPAKQGAFNTIGGYFLKQDPALFDAAFFNITQAEAEAMGRSAFRQVARRGANLFQIRSRDFCLSVLTKRLRTPAFPRNKSSARRLVCSWGATHQIIVWAPSGISSRPRCST